MRGSTQKLSAWNRLVFPPAAVARVVVAVVGLRALAIELGLGVSERKAENNQSSSGGDQPTS